MPCNIDGAGYGARTPTEGEDTDKTVEGVTLVSEQNLFA